MKIRAKLLVGGVSGLMGVTMIGAPAMAVEGGNNGNGNGKGRTAAAVAAAAAPAPAGTGNGKKNAHAAMQQAGRIQNAHFKSWMAHYQALYGEDCFEKDPKALRLLNIQINLASKDPNSVSENLGLEAAAPAPAECHCDRVTSLDADREIAAKALQDRQDELDRLAREIADLKKQKNDTDGDTVRNFRHKKDDDDDDTTSTRRSAQTNPFLAQSLLGLNNAFTNPFANRLAANPFMVQPNAFNNSLLGLNLQPLVNPQGLPWLQQQQQGLPWLNANNRAPFVQPYVQGGNGNPFLNQTGFGGFQGVPNGFTTSQPSWSLGSNIYNGNTSLLGSSLNLGNNFNTVYGNNGAAPFIGRYLP